MTAENEVVPFDKNVPPIILRKGLYEFMMPSGDNELVYVDNEGIVTPLKPDLVDVTDFWRAYADSIVYRLARVSRKLRNEAWEPHLDDRVGYELRAEEIVVGGVWLDVNSSNQVRLPAGLVEMNSLGVVRWIATREVIAPEFAPEWKCWLIRFKHLAEFRGFDLLRIHQILWPNCELTIRIQG